MLRKLKNTISILLSVVLVVCLLSPTIVSAAEAQRAEAAIFEALSPSKDALFSTSGKLLSAGLRQAFTARNIKITDNTLIEFVGAANHNATAIVITNVEGFQITKCLIMAIDENGEYQSLSDAEIADLTSSQRGGGAALVAPFGDSLEIDFMVSFNAYVYAGYWYGLVQPQTAMFIYYDDNDLYDVSSISMTYGCSGIEGYYTNGNFQGITGPLDFFRYDIDVYRNNPAPNSYYSTSDPFPSNKAIMMTSGPNGAGAHFVEYTIVAYRKSNNKRVTIEDSTFLDLA